MTHSEIWKFTLSDSSRQVIEMPEGAKILCVQIQQGIATLWAFCPDIPNPYEKGKANKALLRMPRIIRIIGTGEWVPNNTASEAGQLAVVKADDYIGTIQQGSFVWHVFEEKIQ